MTAVRLAGPDDERAVVRTVADAFVGDPAWDWMLGAGNLEAAEAFARALFLARVARGTAWVADDGAAVAMWDRVDGSRQGGGEDFWRAFEAGAGDAVAARVREYDDAVKTRMPSPPFWYLGVLATAPSRQGSGLATAVLGPGLARADAEGWDCWLETSKPGNKAFYAGRGFTESIAVDVPGGPPTWWLRRPAP